MAALTEEYLEIIPVLQEAMNIVIRDYKTLVDSAGNEFSLMVKINHAQQISRIGFIVQEAKDLKSEVLLAIQNRANEINNQTAECIMEAEQELETAAASVGSGVSYAANQLQILNDFLFDGVIDVTINELSFIISLFEFEFITLITFFNPVTNMFDLLSYFQLEIQLFFILFEYFVDEILVDMEAFHLSTDALNRVMFLSLESYAERFRVTGISILTSLGTCNE